MDTRDLTEVVEDARQRQRDTVRWYLFFAVGVLGVGIVILAIALFVPKSLVPADQKWLVTLGGTFITSLCSFPLHQVTAARNRLGTLGLLERLIDKAAARGEPVDPRIEERILKILET